jgi:hypothetical protein
MRSIMAEGSNHRDGKDLVLPAFELDCRDWLVLGPQEAGMPEDVAGAPLLAVLSTVVIDEDLQEATGALTVGVLEASDELSMRAVAPGSAAYEFVDVYTAPGTRRYVMPAPNEHGLALLAEFVVGEGRDACDELDERVDRLMQSFKWQVAA